MPRPDLTVQTDQEALFPESDFDENDTLANFNQNAQPGTSRAIHSTVILADDPNLSPRSDGGEILHNLRKRKIVEPDSTEKPAKQKPKKGKSLKRKAAPVSMMNICDKINTCALQAQDNGEDAGFKSDMFHSLEVATPYVPKRGNNDGEETSSDDDNVGFCPKASTPK